MNGKKHYQLKCGPDTSKADISKEPMETVSLDAVRYDKQTGLAPVVVQNYETRQVLMVAYANREALKRTFGTGQAWFWSRSRQDYWQKGETSGNVLKVLDIRLDCDGDTVLYLVDAAGPACHTGAVSCFYRRMTYSAVKSPEALTGKAEGEALAGDDTGVIAEEIGYAGLAAKETVSPNRDALRENIENDTLPQTLSDLWRTVEERHRKRPNGSYTTYLFEQGIDKIAKKVGEEAVEVAIAGKNAASLGTAGMTEVAQESADLLYHLLVLWKQSGVTPNEVASVLRKRER